MADTTTADDRSIESIAGTGALGHSGDGGAAVEAKINHPLGLAVDSFGVIYFADQQNHRVRKITGDGKIQTIAGTGTAGSSGDNGSAVSAQLDGPYFIAFNSRDELFIADSMNHKIRKVNAEGDISTVVGGGTSGYSGDSGSAVSANLNRPRGIAFDADDNLYIADSVNHRVRKVDTSGIITTFAGTGKAGYSGDSGDATAAQLHTPATVAVGADGSVYIGDWVNHRIRKVAPDGNISTVAGTGDAGFSGDGGSAIEAKLHSPYMVTVDEFSNLYIGDVSNRRVRMVNAVDNTISTVAGTGQKDAGGAGTARTTHFDTPYSVALDRSGGLLIGDYGGQRIHRVKGSFGLDPDRVAVKSFSSSGTGWGEMGPFRTSSKIYTGLVLFVDLTGVAGSCTFADADADAAMVTKIETAITDIIDPVESLKAFKELSLGSTQLKLEYIKTKVITVAAADWIEGQVNSSRSSWKDRDAFVTRVSAALGSQTLGDKTLSQKMLDADFVMFAHLDCQAGRQSVINSQYVFMHDYDANTDSRTFLHELFHTFSLPDLYPTSGGHRLGPWDLMADARLATRLVGWHRLRCGLVATNSPRIRAITTGDNWTGNLVPWSSAGGVSMIAIQEPGESPTKTWGVEIGNAIKGSVGTESQNQDEGKAAITYVVELSPASGQRPMRLVSSSTISDDDGQSKKDLRAAGLEANDTLDVAGVPFTVKVKHRVGKTGFRVEIAPRPAAT